MPDLTCDPAALVADAKCFSCIPKEMQGPVIIYLLADISGSTLDPAALVRAAKCFQCIPREVIEDVQTFLLCQIVNS